MSAALLDEARPLLAEHWREIAPYDDIPLDVDTHHYLAAGEAGVCRCYTVRVGDQLVGYALFFVRPAPHYAGSLQAAQDVLYLHPSMRGGAGAEFIAYCDEQLRACGVQVVHHHAKHAHPQLGKALERLGYEPVETIYSKRLDVGRDSLLLNGDPTAIDAPRGVLSGADLIDFSDLMRQTIEGRVFAEMGCEDGG